MTNKVDPPLKKPYGRFCAISDTGIQDLKIECLGKVFERINGGADIEKIMYDEETNYSELMSMVAD